MAPLARSRARKPKEKPYGLSRRIWGAVIAAVIAFTVKNSWEFVSYQLWLKDQILLLNQEQAAFHAQLDAEKEFRNREHDEMGHRLDLVIEDVREKSKDK